MDLEIEAWREALAVMAAAGIPALNMDKYPFAMLAPLIRYAPKALIRPILRSQIGGARGGKMPSLHIDLHGNKGRSEVGWLNGAVVRKGRKSGVATPVNGVLTDVLPGRAAGCAAAGRITTGCGRQCTAAQVRDRAVRPKSQAQNDDQNQGDHAKEDKFCQHAPCEAPLQALLRNADSQVEA